MPFSNLTKGQELMLSRRWRWNDSFRVRVVHPLVGFQIDFQVERFDPESKRLVLRPTPYWTGEYGYSNNSLIANFVSAEKLEFVEVEADFSSLLFSNKSDDLNERLTALFGAAEDWGTDNHRTADLATLCLESGNFRIEEMPIGTGELQVLTRAKSGDNYLITILDVDNAEPVKMRLVRVFTHNYQYCVILARSNENNEVCPSSRLVVALQSASVFETLSEDKLFDVAREYLTLCEMNVPANLSESISIFGEFVDVSKHST